MEGRRHLGRRLAGSVVLIGLLAGLAGVVDVARTAATEAEPADQSALPVGEPIKPLPAMPAEDPRRAALGASLFNDPRLGRDGARTCASCHDISTNGASANAHDLAPDGKPNMFNTNTVFNAVLSFRMDWEGDARTLEEQANKAIQLPDIMGSTMPDVLQRLANDPALVSRFREIYGHEPDQASLLDAIATFERTLVTPGARFDAWLKGDASALNAGEKAGYALFKAVGCAACHQGVNVGGNLYERYGIFADPHAPGPRVLRVPSLRNVATTPPYFHDGSASTLHEAVRTMADVQLSRALTDTQVDLIVRFLDTLTGRYQGHDVRAPR